MEKRFWQSRTFWVGVLEIVTAIGLVLAEFLRVGDFGAPAITLFVTGALTIVLRFVTSEPIR